MGRVIKLAAFCAVLVGCNAESPTALSDFNPASIHGKWAVTFSAATCSLREIQLSFTQFSDGGALPETIRLLGSWQTIGENANADLLGELIRDSGELRIELIEDVRIMEGIVLDNDNLALGYHDATTGCRARAAVRRID